MRENPKNIRHKTVKNSLPFLHLRWPHRVKTEAKVKKDQRKNSGLYFSKKGKFFTEHSMGQVQRSPTLAQGTVTNRDPLGMNIISLGYIRRSFTHWEWMILLVVPSKATTFDTPQEVGTLPRLHQIRLSSLQGVSNPLSGCTMHNFYRSVESSISQTKINAIVLYDCHHQQNNSQTCPVHKDCSLSGRHVAGRGGGKTRGSPTCTHTCGKLTSFGSKLFFSLSSETFLPSPEKLYSLLSPGSTQWEMYELVDCNWMSSTSCPAPPHSRPLLTVFPSRSCAWPIDRLLLRQINVSQVTNGGALWTNGGALLTNDGTLLTATKTKGTA